MQWFSLILRKNCYTCGNNFSLPFLPESGWPTLIQGHQVREPVATWEALQVYLLPLRSTEEYTSISQCELSSHALAFQRMRSWCALWPKGWSLSTVLLAAWPGTGAMPLKLPEFSAAAVACTKPMQICAQLLPAFQPQGFFLSQGSNFVEVHSPGENSHRDL